MCEQEVRKWFFMKGGEEAKLKFKEAIPKIKERLYEGTLFEYG